MIPLRRWLPISGWVGDMLDCRLTQRISYPTGYGLPGTAYRAPRDVS